jgi:hypothetical protein
MEVFMFCRNCGKELVGTPEICLGCGAKPLAGSNFCQACGAEINPLAEICTKCGARLAQAEAVDISPKSRLTTTLLCVFLGSFGAHRFYLGKTATAVGMLLLSIIGHVFWILGVLEALGFGVGSLILAGFGWTFIAAVVIWAFIDFIMAIAGAMKDKKGKPIKNW